MLLDLRNFLCIIYNVSKSVIVNNLEYNAKLEISPDFGLRDLCWSKYFSEEKSLPQFSAPDNFKHFHGIYMCIWHANFL